MRAVVLRPLAAAALLLAAAASCQGERVQCEPCDVARDCEEDLLCVEGEGSASVCLERCDPTEDACGAGLRCDPDGRCVPLEAPDTDGPSDFGCSRFLSIEGY